MSDNEKKGVAAVVEFYGGSCGWSKGFEYENGKNEDYFELNISGSALMQKYADKVEMPASNAAYLFYSQLGKDQKKYSHIHVNVDLKKYDRYEISYPTKDLNEISKFTPYVALIEQLMHAKDYATLWATFDEEIQAELSEEILRDFFEKTNAECGLMSELQFQGFRLYESDDDGRPMVQLACVAVREKENTPLSLFFDREARKLMGMNEKF